MESIFLVKSCAKENVVVTNKAAKNFNEVLIVSRFRLMIYFDTKMCGKLSLRDRIKILERICFDK